MSPLRIFVLAVLLYIGYRLVRSTLTGDRDKKTTTKDSETESGTPVEDVLMEDPVCHSLVPKQQAIRLQHRGSTVYFCSEKCCNTFIAQQGED